MFTGVILTQSDVKMAIFTQLPVWYIAVFIVKRREWADKLALINSLPSEY